ncbi:hypothetical protein [Actinomyces naeslundii]|uniref:hypothetical protein n=1 Tax=Actinomyces naeslundii TaxID=1655 RepID=UPI00096F4064|nr:hypothetical protein [Actinomyces naeslundii]OMG22046.1 hypothetical protein BKH37_07500 [Actinomyces naeslundii]OMG26308.1 hypothetical protein BKH35_11580 [Actinomyces naeslundii]OMG27700.1 hypothetical protein BKH36_04975 [Actinomyces naeslundii]OMG31161.1 hypothetical protein BKH34_08540 [Actinomyces naeslundii]OMG35301.1 hypothetical protein BKH25_05125 [Actinomyces naeslundii]
MSQPLAITVGDRFPVGERLYRLTPRLAESTIAARSVLLDIAEHREVITYGELSESIGRSVLPRHMGPLLSMVGHDCAARGEPSLASLVVSAATGEVGTRDESWAPPERLACWARWGGGVLEGSCQQEV